MTNLNELAEAKIREWLERPPAERETTSPALEADLPLEVQLMVDIAQLDRLAHETQDRELAEAMTRKASELELRLMIVLENQGRPLAAQHFAAQRRALRQGL